MFIPSCFFHAKKVVRKRIVQKRDEKIRREKVGSLATFYPVCMNNVEDGPKIPLIFCLQDSTDD